MSQLTGARSMQGASDEVHECEPCTFQGIQKYAQYLCQDCIEYMCNACRGVTINLRNLEDIVYRI